MVSRRARGAAGVNACVHKVAIHVGASTHILDILDILLHPLPLTPFGQRIFIFDAFTPLFRDVSATKPPIACTPSTKLDANPWMQILFAINLRPPLAYFFSVFV